MKTLIAVLVLFCFFAASDSTKRDPRLHLVSPPVAPKHADFDLCSICFQLSGEGLTEILNIILNVGLLGGCNELCSLIKSPELLQTACNIVCDVVGIKIFVDVIQRVDLDTIYFCELLKLCKVNDHGDAEIRSLTITPNDGPAGTVFQIKLDFTTRNGTGTGELIVDVDTIDGLPVTGGELLESLAPGAYSVSMNLNTGAACQQEPCESWQPGTYNVTTTMCNGECGSSHPHSQIYANATRSFQITQ